jgi:hypothetical protein
METFMWATAATTKSESFHASDRGFLFGWHHSHDRHRLHDSDRVDDISSSFRSRTNVGRSRCGNDRLFVIENIPGCGGSLGAGNAARAAADGYTLLLGTSSLSVARALGAPLPYDVVRDFAPIIHLADAPRVLAVSAALPYRSMTELIAGARQRPGVLNYASSGIGTIPHLSAEEFKLLARVDITHVPYFVCQLIPLGCRLIIC